MYLKTSIPIKIVFVLSVLSLVLSCNQSKDNFGKAISTDFGIIAKGGSLFAQKCASCHNFRQHGIGPNLSGLTRTVETEWIKSFITNPQKLISEKDERAVELMQKYQVPMPSFEMLSEHDLDALMSYLHTHDRTKDSKTENLNALMDPMPDSLDFSNLVAKIELVAQFPPSAKKTPLTRINKMSCEKKSERLFVNDLRGVLYEISGTEISQYLSLKTLEKKFISEPGLGTGFGSFAFHPDFMENGLLYTTHAEPANSAPADFAIHDSISSALQWVLKEWRTEKPDSRTFEGRGRELMRVDFFGTIHGMQEIAFNPTADESNPDYGKLYICLGDGASVQNGFQYIADHNAKRVWSSILRIDPLKRNSKNGQYGIPEENPFANEKDKAGEVWAYGFRNPNKLAWTPSGKLLTSDIGHLQIEEVNVVEAGKFYGWPIREGTFEIRPDGDMSQVFTLPENDNDFNVTYPLLQYDHSEGAAISGGYVGRHKTFSNKLVFGDIPTGNLYISNLNQGSEIEKLRVSFNDSTTHFKKIVNDARVDLRLGQDCNGSVYLFTKADGKIYRIVN